MYKCSKLNCWNNLTKENTILNKLFFYFRMYVYFHHKCFIGQYESAFYDRMFWMYMHSNVMDSQVGMYKHLQKHNQHRMYKHCNPMSMFRYSKSMIHFSEWAYKYYKTGILRMQKNICKYLAKKAHEYAWTFRLGSLLCELSPDFLFCRKMLYVCFFPSSFWHSLLRSPLGSVKINFHHQKSWIYWLQISSKYTEILFSNISMYAPV